MNIKKCAIIAAFVALAGCTTVRVDPGGQMTGYVEKITQTQKTGEKVVIDYECDSACLILLSSGSGLQISKDATFGVHETRFVIPGTSYWDKTSIRSETGTKMLQSRIPACAVKLFESKNAFDHPTLTYFKGEEVLKACPEIQECTGKE